MNAGPAFADIGRLPFCNTGGGVVAFGLGRSVPRKLPRGRLATLFVGCVGAVVNSVALVLFARAQNANSPVRAFDAIAVDGAIVFVRVVATVVAAIAPPTLFNALSIVAFEVHEFVAGIAFGLVLPVGTVGNVVAQLHRVQTLIVAVNAGNAGMLVSRILAENVFPFVLAVGTVGASVANVRIPNANRTGIEAFERVFRVALHVAAIELVFAVQTVDDAVTVALERDAFARLFAVERFVRVAARSVATVRLVIVEKAVAAIVAHFRLGDALESATVRKADDRLALVLLRGVAMASGFVTWIRTRTIVFAIAYLLLGIAGAPSVCQAAISVRRQKYISHKCYMSY